MRALCFASATVLMYVCFAEPPRPAWVRHVVAEDFHTFTAVAADFTGDGLVDIIANGGPRRQDVLFVAPDWKPIVLHEGIEAIHAAVLDVDGDGKLDYVAARYSPGLIYALKRPPHPVRDPWPMIAIDDAAKGGADGVHGLLAGDVNGDGVPDLIANSGGPGGGVPNSLVWFSAPRWDSHVIANGDAPGTTHYVALGDVNGDGRPDVATAAKLGNWFAWWEAPRDPRQRWTKHTIAEAQGGATNIAIADINGDGRDEFICARGHGKGLLWFEGPPSYRAHPIDSELIGPHSLAVGDLNGDGFPDIASCAKDSKIVSWFENDGKGSFTRHDLQRDQAGYDLRLIDMDGDGDLDILLAGQDSKNVLWFENRLRPSGRKSSGEFRKRSSVEYQGVNRPGLRFRKLK